MCKQKFKLGLLICSLQVLQVQGIDNELRVLTNSLNELSTALLGEMPPPPPERDIEFLNEPQGGINLPPPSVPTEGKILPVDFGVLPPPPPPALGTNYGVAPETPKPPKTIPVVVKPVMPKPQQEPKVFPVTQVETPALENIPPMEQPSDIKAKLKAMMGSAPEGAVKPNIKLGKGEKVQSLIAVKVPTYKISMLNLTNNMQQLEQAPTLKQFVGMLKQKKQSQLETEGVIPQRTRAHAILNGILALVQSNSNVDKAKIAAAVQRILEINPLLISTASLVLEKIGYDQEQIRAIMIHLFKKQVDFIIQRFAEEQATANITAGARDDIDEAVSYPMEIAGALRLAENNKLMSERKTDASYVNADHFLQAIDAEKQRLCAEIQKNESKFGEFPEYLAVYNLYCGKMGDRKVDVYCTTPKCTYGPGLKDVKAEIVDLSTAIQELLQKIDNYRTTQVGSKKVMIMQEILGTLSDFNYFFNNPHFCRICLKNALRTVAQRDPRFERALNQIGQFIYEVAQQQQNKYLTQFVEQTMPSIKAVMLQVEAMPENQAWDEYSKAKAHWAKFH